MKKIDDLLKNLSEKELDLKLASVFATRKYISDDNIESIGKEVDSFMEFDKAKNYVEKVGCVSSALELLAQIVMLKKLENNPEHMRFIAEKTKDVAEMLMDCYE